MSYETGVISCEDEECDKTVPNHKWGVIKEGSEWFFSKEGPAYCPEHLPDWVESWRRKRK